MRYKIYYQESGSSQFSDDSRHINQSLKKNIKPVNTDKLLIKLREHKMMLDKELGPDTWAFTGSSAVIVYGLSENVDITEIPEPNDINIIYQTDLSSVNFEKVGDYKPSKQSKHKSTIFTNPFTNEDLDIIAVKKLLKNTAMGLPLAKVQIMNNIYKDLENGQVIGNDLIKALVLDKVLEKNPTIDGKLPPAPKNEYNLPVIPLYT